MVHIMNFFKSTRKKFEESLLEEVNSKQELILSNLFHNYNESQKEKIQSLEELKQIYPDDYRSICDIPRSKIELLTYRAHFDSGCIILYQDLLVENKKEFINKLKSGLYDCAQSWYLGMWQRRWKFHENKEQFIICGKVNIKDISINQTIKHITKENKWNSISHTVVAKPYAKVHINKIYDSCGRDTIINVSNQITH